MHADQNQNPPENPSDTIRASWNFSADKIRQATAHYTPEEQDALIALFLWCIDEAHPMRRDECARRIKCSGNLLYQLLTGIYRKPDKIDRETRKIIERGELLRPSAELIKSIRDFLSIEAQRFLSGANEFVSTPTAKKVFTACDLARESQSPVILWSTSHIGKTWALQHYQQTNNHGKTYFCELEAASGLGGMVRQIAKSVGVTADENTAGLIERIKKALTPNTVLILDEVHLLKHTYRLNSFFACIEVIRRIYDKTKCGMVLSWTNLDNLANASQGELIQIWRRGVHKIALPSMPTKADLGTIFHHNGFHGGPVTTEGKNPKPIENTVFPAPDLKVVVKSGRTEITETPYEIIRQLAKNSGLKSITERIRYARKLAKNNSDKVSWTWFAHAHVLIEKQSIAEGEWV